MSSYKMWETDVKNILFAHLGDVPDDFETVYNWFDDFVDGIAPAESVEQFINRLRDQ